MREKKTKTITLVLICMFLLGMTQLAMAADVKVNLGNKTKYYLDFCVDGQRTWTAMPGEPTWLMLPGGTHNLYAVAVDNGKKTAVREVTLRGDGYYWHVYLRN